MTFYQSRINLGYYKIARSWLESLGPREAILDVGCWDSPVATWGDFRLRYTVDSRQRPDLPGVTKVVAAWPDAARMIPDPVSVVTCLQVIEHIPEVRPFVDALFAAASQYVVLSVPYRWPAGMCRQHVHDPIDDAKLQWMTGRTPCRTVLTKDQQARIVAIYEAV
jgi:hypothetical protein